MQYLLLFVLTPQTVAAFDYGPAGNNAFWVVLALWSFMIAYVLMQKTDSIWSGIAYVASMLLSPGVRPHRLPRNPHIVVDDHRASVHEVQHKPHVPAASHYAPIAPTHAPAHHQGEVLHTHHTEEQKRPHVVGTAGKPEFGPVALANSTYAKKVTKDSLSLEIVAGVPKLILKREG